MIPLLKTQSPTLLLLFCLWCLSFFPCILFANGDTDSLPCIFFLYGPPESGRDSFSAMIQNEFHLPSLHPGAALIQTLVDSDRSEYDDDFDMLRIDTLYQLLLRYLTKDRFPRGLLIENFDFSPNQLEEILIHTQQSFRPVALSIKADERFLLEKTAVRLYCPFCGAIYDTSVTPTKICTMCKKELITREADRPEIVRHRFSEYIMKYSQAIDFFRKKNLLVEIQALPNFAENENIIRCFVQLKTGIQPKNS